MSRVIKRIAHHVALSEVSRLNVFLDSEAVLVRPQHWSRTAIASSRYQGPDRTDKDDQPSHGNDRHILAALGSRVIRAWPPKLIFTAELFAEAIISNLVAVTSTCDPGRPLILQKYNAVPHRSYFEIVAIFFHN
jgi:hypothetical protein